MDPDHRDPDHRDPDHRERLEEARLFDTASRARPSFKSMRTESCGLLIYEAIARAPVPFCRAFFARVEEHAPIGLAFLAHLRERMQQEARAS